MAGHFITFEGIEGSGKTTQIARLGRYLKTKGYPVLTTREPGGTPIGDKIRSILLNGGNKAMDARTELLLYLASRAQHLNEVILPALTEGKIILCDRFTDATVVYQGYGRKIPLREVTRLCRFASLGLQPHLTILLDIDVPCGLARLAGRGKIDRLDRETQSFHAAIRRGYLRLAKAEPRRIVVISSKDDPDRVASKIEEAVDAYIS